jgi:anti-sigma regulatory factor (Ser/Thr protein kinase)
VPGYRSGSLGLPACPESVPQARHAALAALREWGLDELSDDAALVVTELVGNAIQVTGRAGLDAPVRLILLAGLRTLLVAVKDAVPLAAGRPVTGTRTGRLAPWSGDDSTDPDQHGNGLIVVAALAVRLDWKPAPGGGKVVRALLRGEHRSLTRGSPAPGMSPAPAPRTARPLQAGSHLAPGAS